MNFETFQQGRSLSKLCTFGIGGPAEFFLEVHDVEKMQECMSFCFSHQLPFLILGKGSNCLFDDKGFKGLVLLNKIDFLEKKNIGVYHVGAGYSFSLLGSKTAREGFSGLEFASGIPGTVGGAVFMNAGANGKETYLSLVSVDFVNEKGILETFLKEELHFSYRKSSFQEKKGAIVGATFKLTPKENARAKQLEIVAYRKETQPYSDKSAGCIFRNPDCGAAGALIDRSGLKGLSIGGAQISELHANFIVNKKGATAQDIRSLIALIQKKIKEEKNINLESEIRIIPYE